MRDGQGRFRRKGRGKGKSIRDRTDGTVSVPIVVWIGMESCVASSGEHGWLEFGAGIPWSCMHARGQNVKRFEKWLANVGHAGWATYAAQVWIGIGVGWSDGVQRVYRECHASL